MIDKSRALDDAVELVKPRPVLQPNHVIDIARGILPSLAAEDIQNPHDFPERKDTDWHLTDETLAADPSILAALGAMNNRKLEPRAYR